MGEIFSDTIQLPHDCPKIWFLGFCGNSFLCEMMESTDLYMRSKTYATSRTFLPFLLQCLGIYFCMRLRYESTRLDHISKRVIVISGLPHLLLYDRHFLYAHFVLILCCIVCWTWYFVLEKRSTLKLWLHWLPSTPYVTSNSSEKFHQ